MANKKKRSTVVLEYEVQVAAQLNEANERIKRGVLGIGEAATLSGKEAGKAFDNLGDEGKDLVQGLLRAKRGFDILGESAPDALNRALKQAKALNTEIKEGQIGVRDFDKEFSDVSRQVALAGDVETSARTLGGAIGAFGAPGIERGIATISELPASIEAVARFRSSISGLPAAIGSAATAIGPVGIGLGAVAIASAVAFKVLSDGMNRAKEEAKAFAKQQAENAKTFADITQLLQRGDFEAAGQLVQQGLDEQENAHIRIAQLERDITQQRIADLEELGVSTEDAARLITLPIKEALEELSGLTGVSNDLLEAVDALEDSEAVKQLRNQIGELTSGELKDAINVTIAHQEALGEYGMSLFDALEATKEVAEAEEQRNAALLEQAELTRSNFLKEQALLEQSTEQLTERSEAISTEIEALNMARDVLLSTADATEDVTAKIAEYRDTLQQLGQEQEFINNQALQTARFREDQIAEEERLAELEEQQLEDLKERAEAFKKAIEERSELEKKFADDLVKLAERAADEAEKALQKLEQKLVDLGQSFVEGTTDVQRKQQRKLLEDQIKAQQAEADAFRDHARTLSDIQLDQQRSEEDNAQSRNFLAIFNSRRATRRRIEDEQKEFVRQRQDANTELGRQRDDRQRAFEEERQDRLVKFQRDIARARNQFAQEQQLAQQNAIAAVMTRRQQYQQELTDLQQVGGATISLRRQIANAELQLLQGVAQAGISLFSQLQAAQQAFSQSSATAPTGVQNEFFDEGNDFASFGGNGGDTINNTDVTGNVTVITDSNQGNNEVADMVIGTLGRLIN